MDRVDSGTPWRGLGGYVAAADADTDAAADGAGPSRAMQVSALFAGLCT